MCMSQDTYLNTYKKIFVHASKYMFLTLLLFDLKGNRKEGLKRKIIIKFKLGESRNEPFILKFFISKG